MGRTQQKKRKQQQEEHHSDEDDEQHVITPASKNPNDHRVVAVGDALFDAAALRVPEPARKTWKVLAKEVVAIMRAHIQREYLDPLRMPCFTLGKLRREINDKFNLAVEVSNDDDADRCHAQLRAIDIFLSYDQLVPRVLSLRGWYTVDGAESFFGKGLFELVQQQQAV